MHSKTCRYLSLVCATTNYADAYECSAFRFSGEWRQRILQYITGTPWHKDIGIVECGVDVQKNLCPPLQGHIPLQVQFNCRYDLLQYPDQYFSSWMSETNQTPVVQVKISQREQYFFETKRTPKYIAVKLLQTILYFWISLESSSISALLVTKQP